METDMSKQKTFFDAINQSSRAFFIVQFSLRVLVIAFTLAAAIILVTSEQSVTIFGIVMKATYTYSSACKFKLVADAFVCACTIMSVLFVCASTRPKSNPINYFYLFLHDLVMVVMLISGCAAGTATGYVAKYGQNETGWMAICDRVAKFCDKVSASMALSYVAFFCMFVLTIMAAYPLKSLPH